MSEWIHHWVGWSSSFSVKLGFRAICPSYSLESSQQSSQQWKAMPAARRGNSALRECSSLERVSVVKTRVRKSCSKWGLLYDLRSCCWWCTVWELWKNELSLRPPPGRLCSLETVSECNLQKESHAMLHRSTFCSFHFQFKVCMGYLLLKHSFQNWLCLSTCFS